MVQFMMCAKAEVFGDPTTRDLLIMDGGLKPAPARILGRTVKGFNRKVWSEKCAFGTIRYVPT